ncbi:MAG: sugar phosphate isomerase/epimerase family protein [Eubacteriales bacterium]
MDYSIQLYSCRDAMKEDMNATLKKIAEIGYTMVEPAGFFGHTAEEVKSMLDEYGLKVSGTHTGWTLLSDDNFAETVKFHKVIGTSNIILPSIPYWEGKERLAELIDFINKIQPRLDDEGMRLAYHNHSGEFVPTGYGALVHKELEEKTDIDFEIDTFWAFNAGVDPISLLERLKDRVHFIHIKDGFVKKGETPAKGMPLGLGEAPVAAVYSKAKELGMQMVVESETQQPDGITEAKICFDFLKSQEK